MSEEKPSAVPPRSYVSWIALERFWRDPALFGAAETEPGDKRHKLSQLFGKSLCHLHPAVWKLDALNLRAKDRRSDATQRVEAEAVAQGLIPLTTPEYEEADGLITAGHPIALEWFGNEGLTETTVLADYGKHITLKDRLFMRSDGTPVIVKVVEDIAHFPNTVFQARYDRLAAVLCMLLGGPRTVLMLVRDLRPAQRQAIFRLDEDSSDLRLAINEVHLMLNALDHSLDTGMFATVAKQHIPLKRPHWLPVVSSLSQEGVHLWPTQS